jgi:hypothetical protein
MSGLRRPPDVEIAEVRDQALSAAVTDKSSKGGSGKHVAQVRALRDWPAQERWCTWLFPA